MKTLPGLLLIAEALAASPTHAGPQWGAINRGVPHHADHTRFGFGYGGYRGWHHQWRCAYIGGSLVFIDPFVYGTNGSDDTDYQGQEAEQGASLPYATPTSAPSIVISPYPPNAHIDVSGIPRGAKVQDPVSGEVFLNP
jgi:hypothetical protein